MGANYSTQSRLKNDVDTPCVETFFKSPRLRFAFKMKATKEEAQRLDEKWSEFTSHVSNDFVYFTDTRKTPQYIKISRNGDKLQLNVSTTIDLKEEDIEKFTYMFAHATGAIHRYYSGGTKAGAAIKEKSSSLNLLALDK